MIHCDINFLIGLDQPRGPEARALRTWIEQGRAYTVSAIAWTEFLCGPLPPAGLAQMAALFPAPEPYEPADAELAARLFNQTGRRRGSLIDCMIAAVALRRDAALATRNLDDFRPLTAFGLQLVALGKDRA